MFHLKLLLPCLMLANTASAQDGDLLQYQQEVGGGIGLASYLGDAHGGFMRQPSLMGAFIWRRNLNARMVVKTDLELCHLRGTTSGRYFPTDALSHTAAGGMQAATIDFSRNVVDAGVQFELNFLGYGLGAAYKGLSRWTPYMLAGAGITIGFGSGASTCGGINVPIGIGFRYKVRPRVNIAMEWAIHFSTTDRLDDNDAATHLDAPYGIASEGWKNKDSYQTLLLMLTYDISPKYRKCNN